MSCIAHFTSIWISKGIIFIAIIIIIINIIIIIIIVVVVVVVVVILHKTQHCTWWRHLRPFCLNWM